MHKYLQVTKNVINYQINNFIESNGKNPDTMNAAEKENYVEAMIRELYPGQESK